MKTLIHVNQHNVKHNQRHPKDPKPVLTVKTYNSNKKTNSVRINGPSEIVYSPDKPLPCGAKVWLETEWPVDVEPCSDFTSP
jgi:hypothetical protein